MTIKVYISGICGSQEVRKQQQRVLFILQTMPIDLQIIDVTDPGHEEDLVFMQEEAKKHDKKTQLPPQIFNDDTYCGDYADFELANDDDDIMRFLKLETGPTKAELLNNAALESDLITQNGISGHENGESKESAEPLGDYVSNDTGEIISASEEQTILANVESNEDIKQNTELLEKSGANDNEVISEVLDENNERSNLGPTDEKKTEESSEEESEEESE